MIEKCTGSLNFQTELMPADVRFWHKADIATALNRVRFWG
jgi:hypothetical protein